MVGTWGCGQVVESWLSSRTPFVWSGFPHPHLFFQMLNELQEELTIWGGLTHAHILPLYGACLDPGEPLLICEYMVNGNLTEYLAAHPRAKRILLARRFMVPQRELTQRHYRCTRSPSA